MKNNHKNNGRGLGRVSFVLVNSVLVSSALMVAGCDTNQPDVLQGKADTTGYVAISAPRNSDAAYSPVANQTMPNHA